MVRVFIAWLEPQPEVFIFIFRIRSRLKTILVSLLKLRHFRYKELPGQFNPLFKLWLRFVVRIPPKLKSLFRRLEFFPPYKFSGCVLSERSYCSFILFS